MNVNILNDYEAMSRTAADFIIRLVKEKPTALICFAAGDTPKETLRLLVQAVKENKVDFKQAAFVGLDEWEALGIEDEGSCLHFLYNNFYMPAGIQESQIHFFDAKAQDLQAECEKMDRIIYKHQGIDLILLGLGVNGHLGFNEPGVNFESLSHVSELDPITNTVGQKYFKEQRVLSKGITIGIKHILDAKAALLIANGSKKKEAVHAMITGPVINSMPASVLQIHSNAHLFFDRDAYSEISK
jgi:glucosamine-6-phosphate deaminase